MFHLAIECEVSLTDSLQVGRCDVHLVDDEGADVVLSTLNSECQE